MKRFNSLLRSLIKKKNLTADPTWKFINKLFKAKKYPGALHSCPNCEGQLHFHLTILKHRHPRMASAQAWCDDCDTTIAVDGIVPVPDWAEEATRIWDEEQRRGAS